MSSEIAAIALMNGDATMMHGYLITAAGHLMACASNCLEVAGNAAPQTPHDAAPAFAALGSWLMTEGLGAFMLASLFADRRRKRRSGRQASASPPVVYGHAGLALAGFACWVGFASTDAKALAWLGVGFLALAIGLGISTVTIWTPFPAPAFPTSALPISASPASTGTEPEPQAGQPDTDVRSPAPASQPDDLLARTGSPDALAHALSDEALTSKLVDDLLASMLAKPAPRRRTLAWNLAPLIPVAHGVLAIVTFLLATLAAIGVNLRFDPGSWADPPGWVAARLAR